MTLKARKKAAVRAIEIALLAAGASQAAMAQQDAATAQLERIVVTGSNIKRIAAETAEPILSISREDITNSGKATLTEYLQSLSLDGQGSLPTGFGNGFAAGATAISLRGLGANATLVLLNGRRLAPYPRADDFQKMFADLSSVPLEAVERIEVLKDGASAIYGSDALAGVVNIILRKNFDGIIGKVETGASKYGDGKRAKAALTMGAGNLSTDKWNGLLNIEVSKSDEIHYRDRDREWIGKGDTRPWGYDPLASQWTPGSRRGTTVSGSVAGYVRNGTTSGAYQLVSPCTTALPGVVSPHITGDEGCSYDIGQFRSFQPKLEALSIFGRGSVALNQNWEAFAEFSYGKNKTGFDVSPLGTPGTIVGPFGVRGYGTGINVPEMTLAAEHPDNPFGKSARFRYVFGEFGAQRRTNDVDITRIMAGVKGTAAEWDIDAGFAHSESKLDQDYMLLRLQGLLDAFSNPKSATFGYRMGANAGLNTQAQRDSILTHGTSASKTKLDILDIKASREIAQLPGGPAALALGAEYRKLMLSAPSLSGTQDGSVQASYNGFFGNEKVMAAYGEVLAPITKSFELSGAVRYDKYDSFNSTTPKIAAKFVPIPQLALRASYAHGFRAPNPAESSPDAQATFGTGGIHDPIRCPDGKTPLPGGTAADCNGSGVGGFARGNPDLKPEKSKNFNFGFIVEPTKGLNFGADIWQITKSDQIQTISGQEAFARPDVIRSDNNLPGIPNSGSAILIYAPFVNKGESKVAGVDFDFSYRWTVQNVGRFKADAHLTHTAKWELTDAGTTLDYAGTHGNCDVSNCIGTPKNKANVSLTWESGPASLTATMNWRSSIENKNFKGDDCQQSLADGTEANGCKLPSFYSVDLSGRWNLTRELQVYGSIQNLFNRVAPLDTITYGGINYNPMDVAGAMGTFFNVGLRYQFK
ncbi:TonB-dependent receptor [Paucibacter sp. APW11]|uniref:TonB-dependent receptor n=1 Tax=Roseateles aquae TaxID=3077235 RepID=A0ABU3P636_9BURK|nr:TonB-dependent receptor [Paucibacter sp. APW11]MDT8997680.1 TonB-dependent receptor [Paucibacter sp. APW11]